MNVRSSKGEFRARLREVEPGVFRAEYQGELNPDNPDSRGFPDYHVATSEADARVWVEEMARSMGYGPVDGLWPGRWVMARSMGYGPVVWE